MGLQIWSVSDDKKPKRHGTFSPNSRNRVLLCLTGCQDICRISKICLRKVSRNVVTGRAADFCSKVVGGGEEGEEKRPSIWSARLGSDN